MHHSTIVLAAAAAVSLAGCNKPAATKAPDAADTAAAARKAKPAYCFFKEKETKGWKAKADKDGNVVVTGRVFRSDPRYKAILLPSTVSGTAAQVSPTIADNDTGYAAPDNWWTVTQTIPGSQAVDSVSVTCGARTLAELTIPRRK